MRIGSVSKHESLQGEQNRNGLDFPDVKIAHTDEDRNRIFRYRYRLYVQKLGRSSSGAIENQKILCECFDHRSILLYVESSDGKLAGTVSLLRGPFDELVAHRIQMDYIETINPTIEADQLFYISKLMVSDGHRNTSVSSALLLAAFTHSSSLGGAVGLIHCSKSMKQYFLKWGCLEYGVPFAFENVGVQSLMAISTTNRMAHLAVKSLVLSSEYIFPKNPAADEFYQNLTGFRIND